jgi:hypothetical protein
MQDRCGWCGIPMPDDAPEGCGSCREYSGYPCSVERDHYSQEMSDLEQSLIETELWLKENKE